MDDEFFDYRSWAVRTWSGTLMDAVRAEFELARKSPGYVQMRNWWGYDGPTIAPVALYTRWHADRVTIASIAGQGSRRGRLPHLCEAFEATGLTVVWENVMNAPLRYALRRRGYLGEVPEPCPSASLTWTPRTP